jgi:hypothetical protein
MDAFVSEPIEAIGDAIDTANMTTGAPGIPMKFKWRRKIHKVGAVLRHWRETSRCKHGSQEAYVRKHWVEVETAEGLRMKLYFERQARRGANAKKRWWIYSVESD